jgi:hypothetical protein
VKVRTEIEVLAVDDLDRDYTTVPTIAVESYKERERLVNLVIGDRRYTVLATELARAVANASGNSGTDSEQDRYGD